MKLKIDATAKGTPVVTKRTSKPGATGGRIMAARAARQAAEMAKARAKAKAKAKTVPARKINTLIALCGTMGDYTVRTSRFAGIPSLRVENAAVGNALVRVLREMAAKKPDLFPEGTLD